MTILLIPGFMLDADLWTDMGEGLQPFGPTILADLSQGASVTEMASLTLQRISGDFVVLGFSMGGYVAREIVRQAPERVKALILIATSARGDTEVQAKRKAALAAQPDTSGFRGLSTSAIATSLHPDNAARADLISRIQAMGQRLGGEVFRRQSLLDRQDERASLGSITCPTLVIAGDDDKLRSRAEARELHEGIPGSDFEVIEGTGHMIPLEAPERLVEVIAQWLNDLESRG